jgi:hypothetical protein
MNCEQIIKAARIAAEQVPIRENFRQSLPVPILKNKELFLIFLYYNSLNRPRQPSIIDHPSWIQTVRYPSGEVVETRQCTPDEFGFRNKKNPIGELAQPQDMSFTDFIEAEKELLDTIDRLMPAFQLWNNRTDDDRKNIKRFDELFNKIGEPPLKSYYEAIGYNFLHWLRQ